MGHLLFCLIHLSAFLFATGWLIVTVPLHLIYVALAHQRPTQPNARTHVRCPDCREPILKNARVCRYCRCRLEPQ